MRPSTSTTTGRISFAVSILFFLVTAVAEASKLYVAVNGVDGPGCGTKESPCRTIGQAIGSAVAGDDVIVGPGMYGDLNRNGALSGPGEENPGAYAPGCGCMVAVNKPITVTSSGGAAVTLIEGKGVAVNTTVLLITDGGVFGKPGKGFTVTETNVSNPTGIAIDSNNVTVAGNQVLGHSVGATSTTTGTGIGTVSSSGVVLITGNQVFGWETGIGAFGSGKTVKKNVVAHNLRGIQADGTNEIVGNVVDGNHNEALSLTGLAHAIGNALHGSLSAIRTYGAAYGGTIEKNNIFGNSVCGLETPGLSFVQAPNNYWGAATGPGPAPANASCSATAIVTPFASKPFNVKARIKP